MNLGICVRLENLAPSQYVLPFNSVVKFGGKFVGFGPDGVCELGGDTDNGTDIDAVVELPTLDMGVQARLREAYIGYETGGSLTLKTTSDETTTTTYTLSRDKDSQVQQSGKLPLQRTAPGRYWMLRVENVDGCDFSLDEIAVRPVLLGRRGRG